MLKSTINLLRLPPIRMARFTNLVFESHSNQNLSVLSKNLHITSVTSAKMRRDLRSYRDSMPDKDEGVKSSQAISIDEPLAKDDIFPDLNTPNRLFNGIPYKELPIANIKVSKNNTIITITDHKGNVKILRSCGLEGFKNAKKGTNIAAQATAISISTKGMVYGYKTLRVRIQGLGPGRTAAIKGLQMGGANIVSITDNTPVSDNPPRPRKARRV